MSDHIEALILENLCWIIPLGWFAGSAILVLFASIRSSQISKRE